MIQRWWCETPPARHIYLRADSQRAVWRLEWTIGGSAVRAQDFSSESDARAAARAMIAEHPGIWQAYPRQAP